MHIAVCFWTLYVGKNGGVEFWQIFVDEANSEEYFGESDDRSSVVSLYLQALLRKFLANCASFIKFSLSNNIIFPCTLVPIPLEWYIWQTLNLAIWQQTQIIKHLVWRILVRHCHKILPHYPLKNSIGGDFRLVI